jgi:uncharacterized protein (DUF924 family)
VASEAPRTIHVSGAAGVENVDRERRAMHRDTANVWQSTARQVSRYKMQLSATTRNVRRCVCSNRTLFYLRLPSSEWLSSQTFRTPGALL